MKRQLAVLTALILLTAAPALAATKPTQITVVGSGNVALMPDQATVNASVTTNASTAADAVSANNSLYDRVVQAVSATGVKRDDLTLSYYSIDYVPKPQSSPLDPNQRYGFTVNRTFAIRVRAIGKAGAVVDAATGVESVTIGGVSFGVADSSGALKTATSLAMKDARVSAEALASAAGLHIVGIAKISQGGEGPIQPMARMAMKAAPTTFDAGSVNVGTSVTVVYLAAP
jgi:uncharacterized protein